MSDYSELKMLAESATAGPWVSGGTWVSTSKGNSVADCQRGDEKFIAAANPNVVLALIAEVERLKRFGEAFQNGAVDLFEAGMEIQQERDQLKAEVEALRDLKLPEYLKLSNEMRAAGDHAERRAREDGFCGVDSLNAVFFEAAIQVWLNNNEEVIDAAMSKEAGQ